MARPSPGQRRIIVSARCRGLPTRRAFSTGGQTMYKNILVATDGTRLSSHAITHAIALAKALGARLTAFYASPDYPLPVYAEGAIVEPMSRREYAAICKDEADRILGAVAAKAKSSRVAFNAVHT